MGASIPSPIDTPAVWCGEELLQRDDWLVEFDAADVDELLGAAARVASLELADVTSDNFSLPTLASRLRVVQTSLETGSGATVLRGLPSEWDSPDVAQRVFWGIACHLGVPLSQSATGERLFHVRDEGFKADDPRARGPNTRKGLSFHTDRCDVIGFMCLQTAKSGGENDLVSSAALFNEVRRRRPDLLSELMGPYCYQRHNVDLWQRAALLPATDFFVLRRAVCRKLPARLDRTGSPIARIGTHVGSPARGPRLSRVRRRRAGDARGSTAGAG